MTPKTFVLAAVLAASPLAPFALAQTETTTTDGTAPATDTTAMSTDAGTMAGAPTPEQMQAAMTTKAGFAERAASSNMFEIESSKLALQSAQSDAVKTFAQKMIDDHTAAGDKMTAAAQEDGVTPPMALMPDHQAMLDPLKGLEAEAFDAAYIAAQKAAHDDTVALFEGYSTGGEEGALKTFATGTLPTLKEHQTEIDGMAAS